MEPRHAHGTSGWKRVVPVSLRRRVRSAIVARESKRPVDLGDLRRVDPLDPAWGQRGQPIDRYYIEAFLEAQRTDIRGHVLEVGGSIYARRFGTDVERLDVLHVDADDPRATIVADLTDAPQIESDRFDCLIATQVLTYIYDVRAALRTAHRILAPGGVLLVTVPGIARISPVENDRWGDWWRFTTASARRLTEEAFGQSRVSVTSYGNVLTGMSCLYGLAAEDLAEDELLASDPLCEVLVAIRAVKGRAPR